MQVPALGKWPSGAGRSNTCQGNVGAGRATRNTPSTLPRSPGYRYRQAHFLQGTDGTCNFFFFLLLLEGEQQDFLKMIEWRFLWHEAENF